MPLPIPGARQWQYFLPAAVVPGCTTPGPRRGRAGGVGGAGSLKDAPVGNAEGEKDCRQEQRDADSGVKRPTRVMGGTRRPGRIHQHLLRRHGRPKGRKTHVPTSKRGVGRKDARLERDYLGKRRGGWLSSENVLMRRRYLLFD